MILTVNIGNTHITVGGYEHDDLIFCGRLHSDPAATVDEYATAAGQSAFSCTGAAPEQIEGGILGSVVPVLSGRVLAALQHALPGAHPDRGAGTEERHQACGWTIPPSWAQSCCAAQWRRWQKCSGPLVVISADTAISLMAVNGRQELVGGVILPGPQLSLAALVQNTAQLPQIDLSAARARPLCWAKAPPPVCKTALCWALPACWTVWPSRFCAELGPRDRISTPPATCPAPSGRPAAPPSSTGRL